MTRCCYQSIKQLLKNIVFDPTRVMNLMVRARNEAFNLHLAFENSIQTKLAALSIKFHNRKALATQRSFIIGECQNL